MVSGAGFSMAPAAGLLIIEGHGTSMEPGYRQGDVALMRASDGDDVQVGDIILFHAEGTRVFHRVVDIFAGRDNQIVFITQGDNNLEPDPPVVASQIEGRLVTRLPLLGEISRSLGDPGGIAVYRYLVVALSALGLVVCLARRFVRRGRVRTLEPGSTPA